MAGWVYVIEEMGQHLFKVGQTTTTPQERLRQLQTGNGQKLDLLAAFTCEKPGIVEKQLHKLLETRTQRMQGEWFALPREQMLDVLMHLYAGIAQKQGGVRFLASTLATRPSEATQLGESCVATYRVPQIDIDAIRQRVLETTKGRDAESYSTFFVCGAGRVGDIGGEYFGELEIPFEAIAVGGPTHSTYNDNVIALVPKAHGNAEANAAFLLKHEPMFCVFFLKSIGCVSSDSDTPNHCGLRGLRAESKDRYFARYLRTARREEADLGG